MSEEDLPIVHPQYQSRVHRRRSRLLYVAGTIIFAAIAIICFSVALNYRAPVSPVNKNEGLKNFVLMIGDGFGPAHMTLARVVSGVPSLFMERELRGTVRTHSSDSWITGKTDEEYSPYLQPLSNSSDSTLQTRQLAQRPTPAARSRTMQLSLWTLTGCQ